MTRSGWRETPLVEGGKRSRRASWSCGRKERARQQGHVAAREREASLLCRGRGGCGVETGEGQGYEGCPNACVWCTRAVHSRTLSLGGVAVSGRWGGPRLAALTHPRLARTAIFCSQVTRCYPLKISIKPAQRPAAPSSSSSSSHLPMALAPQFATHRIAGTPDSAHTLDVYLDLICPFSKKQLAGIRENVIPLIENGALKGHLSVIVRQVDLPPSLLASPKFSPSPLSPFAGPAVVALVLDHRPRSRSWCEQSARRRRQVLPGRRGQAEVAGVLLQADGRARGTSRTAEGESDR